MSFSVARLSSSLRPARWAAFETGGDVSSWPLPMIVWPALGGLLPEAHGIELLAHPGRELEAAERFGAAILITMIDGAVQGAAASQHNGGTVIYSPSASQDVMTEVLKSTVNIPPTVTKQNGDRIQVFVARDLDFRSVYELRPVVASH